MSRAKFIALTIISIIAATLLFQSIEPEKRMYFVLATMGLYLIFIDVHCARKEND